jgi:hypothetical protein
LEFSDSVRRLLIAGKAINHGGFIFGPQHNLDASELILVGVVQRSKS